MAFPSSVDCSGCQYNRGFPVRRDFDLLHSPPRDLLGAAGDQEEFCGPRIQPGWQQLRCICLKCQSEGEVRLVGQNLFPKKGQQARPRMPLGEELANVLLLACCYQEVSRPLRLDWQRYFALRDRRRPDFAGRGGWPGVYIAARQAVTAGPGIHRTTNFSLRGAIAIRRPRAW
jgi:hypothetical protein